MLFNSFTFILFFTIVYALYWPLRHRGRTALLLTASYAFYMAWRVEYALLLLLTTAVDYAVALGISRWDKRPLLRRALLMVSLCSNLGVLATFKYWTFFGSMFDGIAGWIGIARHWPALDLLLPIGISFYTFQALSYTIDVYRRKLPAERDFALLALYIVFFPQLVAGPIVRATELLGQLRTPRQFVAERMLSGLKLVMLGFFKKMVVADNLSPFVDAVYAPGTVHEPLMYLLATYAFAFQIYADFSGYSDIAIGLARMMGYHFPDNFLRPYFSKTIVEFWHRWHISLSTWLRDYLYIPLGGNRCGRLRTGVNLLLTMLLGGLWHGANWTFVFWGGLHGAALVFSKLTLPWRDRLLARWHIPTRLVSMWRMAVTFHLVCLSWVYFRTQNMAQANDVLVTMFTALVRGRLFATQAVGRVLAGTTLPYEGMLAAGVMLGIDVWLRRGRTDERLHALPWQLRYACYTGLIMLTLIFGVYKASHFIYFQF